MPKIPAVRRLFIVIVISLSLATGLSVSSILYTLNSDKRSSLDSSVRIVSGLEQAAEHFQARQNQDLTDRDDTFRHLLSRDWSQMERCVGERFRDTFGYDFTLITSLDGEVHFRSAGEDLGRYLTADRITHSAITDMISQTLVSPTHKRVPVAGVVEIGGQLVRLSVARVVREDHSIEGYDNDFFLIIGRLIDDEEIQKLTHLIEPQNVELLRGQQEVEGGFYHFIDPKGMHLAALRLEMPYSMGLVESLISLFLIFTLCLLVLGVITFRGFNKMTMFFAESSLVDELTGLYNRRYFNTKGDQEIRRLCRDKKYSAFMVIDLDNFKSYNDLFGYQKGDEVLQEIGHVMTALFRRGGDFSFRTGGEEFAILIHGDVRERLIAMADTLRGVVEELDIEHTGNTPYKRVTVSIGMVLSCPEDRECSLKKLYKRADEALSDAKALGRNRVIFLEN
ncbi:MAG: diguanylate cyclase [Gammaproteobacteria bacterium]|nr:diguanylate cyclase [Gammaproteobacteria bacterium]